jgi:hypothetical protein
MVKSFGQYKACSCCDGYHFTICPCDGRDLEAGADFHL